jgi:hypothetical protein
MFLRYKFEIFGMLIDCRKSMTRWAGQVRVNPGMGLEGPLAYGFKLEKA